MRSQLVIMAALFCFLVGAIPASADLFEETVLYVDELERGFSLQEIETELMQLGLTYHVEPFGHEAPKGRKKRSVLRAVSSFVILGAFSVTATQVDSGMIQGALVSGGAALSGVLFFAPQLKALFSNHAAISKNHLDQIHNYNAKKRSKFFPSELSQEQKINRLHHLGMELKRRLEAEFDEYLELKEAGVSKERVMATYARVWFLTAIFAAEYTAFDQEDLPLIGADSYSMQMAKDIEAIANELKTGTSTCGNEVSILFP